MDKKLVEAILKEMYDLCNDEDRSTEYTIQFLQDSIIDQVQNEDDRFDIVINFLTTS